MLTRCVFCNSSLGTNESIEHFQTGRRVAYDAKRGRLWAICSACQRWNLAPIEDRWEALDELARITRDHGRLLSQTQNIALIRAPDIDIVQVGKAPLVEEAWWRYGRELRRRRKTHQLVNIGQWVAQGALVFGAGFVGMYAYLIGGSPLNHAVRWARFGSTAWRGSQTCVSCGGILEEISFRRARHLMVINSPSGSGLGLSCERCGYGNDEYGFTFSNEDGQRLLRRVLAFYNYSGARDDVIQDATWRIDRAGSPAALLRQLGEQRYRIKQGKEKRELAIALEISINEESERELLELELKELEARWREEEELAAIIDGELTRLPALEKLRLKLR